MRIEESVTIAAPRERVWELIHDPGDYAGLLDWVTTFEPCEEDRDPGNGARYEMLVKVGSANVGGVVEIVEYDEQRDIVWTSVTGVEQRGRFRLRTEPGDQTRLTMRMSYGAPGWLLGTLAELISGPHGSTFVLRRKFDPEQCLADIEEHRCEVLVVVPVMLQRILELPSDTRGRYDTGSLRAVCASGSALAGGLALRWMDEFGDNLYNMYGSTEVSVATLATPKDMRRAPGSAGKPARGSIVRLYDDRDRPVLQGHTGRIFVGNAMLFEGYTGGGSKDQIDGLMATGDVGRFDEAGRLFVEGRDDEMIVSGGENVFPKEVEDVLAGHEAVAEAAAIGVEDDQFGQRLRAFVVLRSGRQASEQDLANHVKANLARYKVPREVVFLDELPRNSTGKVLKRELAEMEPAAGDG